jgi:hypothetical protein
MSLTRQQKLRDILWRNLDVQELGEPGGQEISLFET